MARPSVYPEWTDGDSAKQVEPTSGKKLLGWTKTERPAFQYMNWIHWLTNEWITWIVEQIDGATAINSVVWDAIVGAEDGCTHATLASALADSAIVAGSRIFVRDAETINTTVQVSKNNIEICFHPLAVFTKGSAANGLQVSAVGVRVKGGRFVNFTGAGVLIDSGSDYTTVFDCRFASCTADITDNNGKGALTGNIGE